MGYIVIIAFYFDIYDISHTIYPIFLYNYGNDNRGRAVNEYKRGCCQADKGTLQ